MTYVHEDCDEISAFTHLRQVWNWLGVDCRAFNFHVADHQIYPFPPEDPAWLTGAEMHAWTQAEPNAQAVWAVVSVLPPEAPRLLYPDIYADGNGALWEVDAGRQHPAALFEIVCWDSTRTLYVDVPEPYLSYLLKNAPCLRTMEEVRRGVERATDASPPASGARPSAR